MLRHGSLTASTVAPVNLGSDFGRVAILHKGTEDDGTTPSLSPIYVEVGGASDTIPDPDETTPTGYTIPAGYRRTITFEGNGKTIVKLVSAGAPAFEIEA